MTIPSNIKSKPPLPKYLKYLPFFDLFFNKTAQGVFGIIYLPNSIFMNLKSSNPNPEYLGLILHEQKHLERQKEVGIFKYIFKYIFMPKFRLNEEIIARKEQIRYLKKNNLTYPVEMQARFLSSYVYLWPATYEDVLTELKKASEYV